MAPTGRPILAMSCEGGAINRVNWGLDLSEALLERPLSKPA